MPIFPRSVKSAGNVNYADEVTAGVPDIIDTEVDKDFNDLYQLVNGQIDDDNINQNPYLAFKKIVYDKLNLTGRLQSGDLAPGFTVPGSAITSLPDGVVHINNMAIGASFQALAFNVGTANLGLSPNTETVVAEQTWTTRGGSWIILGLLNGFCIIQTASAGGSGSFTTRLRLGSSAVGVPDGTVLEVTTAQVGAAGFTISSGGITVPLGQTLVAVGGLKPVGSVQRVQLTGTVVPGLCGVTGTTYAPSVWIVELA